MGGGEQRSSQFYSRLCRGEGGISDSCNWSTRVGADVGHDSWSVSSVDLNDSGESPGDVLAGQGGVDHASSQGGSREEGGGDEARGGDEEGEEGPMDGVIGWAWVGKERQLPLTVVKPPLQLIHTLDIPISDSEFV